MDRLLFKDGGWGESLKDNLKVILIESKLKFSNQFHCIYYTSPWWMQGRKPNLYIFYV